VAGDPCETAGDDDGFVDGGGGWGGGENEIEGGETLFVGHGHFLSWRERGGKPGMGEC
jgi:hypothetical protein